MQSLPKKVAFKKFLQQIGFRYYLKKLSSFSAGSY